MYPGLIPVSEKISGLILQPDGSRSRAGVTVAEGRIQEIGPAHADPGGRGAHSTDYGDALLLPGAVDVHVHTRSYAEEGIERCTRAAAAGGVTTIVDMPYDAAGPVDSLAAFHAKVADVGREAVIDVALWATVPPRGPDRRGR